MSESCVIRTENIDELREQFFLSISCFSESDQWDIIQALDFATRAHEGQTRKSWAPYIIHPIAVAIRVQERYRDKVTTIVALLHDTVEDCTVSVQAIDDLFGQQVSFIVDALTKTIPVYHSYPDLHFDSKTEKLLFGIMKDVRCAVVKLADREHNMQSLKNLKQHKQIRMSFETQALFSPLRKIIRCCDPSLTLDRAQQNFDTFMSENSVSQPVQLKSALYNDTFSDFDMALFQGVYRNTDRVVWKIKNQEIFAQLCENPEFDQSVEVISMSGDGVNFEVSFQFIAPYLLDSGQAKMSVSSFSI